jgi:hypothetical protein
MVHERRLQLAFKCWFSECRHGLNRGPFNGAHMTRSQRNHSASRPVGALALCAGLLLVPLLAAAADTTPAEQAARFAALAGAPGQAQRGETFFTSRHGGEWSCASCHGHLPVVMGKHASTGKAIEPMAPAASAKVFTDTARVDKWFRRNCNDVLKRECTAGEKADVLAYLLQVKP